MKKLEQITTFELDAIKCECGTAISVPKNKHTVVCENCDRVYTREGLPINIDLQSLNELNRVF